MSTYRQQREQKLTAVHPQSRVYVLDLAELAEEFAATHETARALELATQAMQAARNREQSGNTQIIRHEELYAECSLAIVHAEAGQFDEALPRLFRVMNQSENHALWDVQAKALRWIGVCYVRISMFTTALEYLTKSRSLAEQHNDTIQEALANSTTGDAHYGLGDAATALKYYREALRLFDLAPDNHIHLKSPILFSLATAHKDLGGIQQATIYYEQALTAYKIQENISGVCLSLLGVADMYSSQERYDRALELLFAALDVALHHGGEFEVMQVNYAIGEVYRKAERPEKALEYLREAEKIVTGSQVVALVAKVHQSLFAAYKAIGNVAQALHHLEIFHDLREQTALQDGKRAIKYLEQGFEMERAQKETEIYRLKNVELAHVQQELERLLLNILPVPIAQRLRQGEHRIADSYEAVTVVFIDLVGFTRLAQRYSAVHVVGMLDHLFSEFDELTLRLGLEKIKTIGDAYMAVAGLPFRQADHVVRAAKFALAVQSLMTDVGVQYGVQARIGIHSGAAVAGVIGRSKFAYDIWGDTVNTASRMESHGEAGKIHISEEVYKALIGHWSGDTTKPQLTNSPTPHTFIFEERGEIEVKGKGVMRTWFLGSADVHSHGQENEE